MIRLKRKRPGVISLVTTVARVIVGACIALSFFTSLAPLAASASAEPGVMACCVGKPGHCNSGLIKKRPSRPAPEPMCGLSRPSEKLSGIEAVDDGIVVVATSEEGSSETSSQGHATPALGASLTRPCPVDCRVGASSWVREPKPRQHALGMNHVHGLRPQRQSYRRSLNAISVLTASLRRIRPRGPPGSSC